MSITTPAITDVVDAYLAALTEADRDRRAELTTAAWTEQARFVDPLLDATGHADIAALADVVIEHYPDFAFRRTSGVDAHHELVRFTWALVGPDGAAALTGTDVGVIAPDGRLDRIAGFFGDPPALDGDAG